MADKDHPPDAPSTSRRLFTLRVLKPFELPEAPSGSLPLREQDPKHGRPSAADFATTALTEALAFLDHTWPMLAPKGSKSSSPAKAQVQLFAQGFNNPHGAREHWFARRSVHEGREEAGTASWREFYRGLFENHSRNEKEYTPDLFDMKEVVDWGAVDMPQGSAWSNVSLQAFEMVHSMPFPLNSRVFPTLVIKGTYEPAGPSKPAFLVVQIPLHLESSAEACYTNERNKELGQTPEQKKAAVIGRYVSVERCTGKEDGSTTWEMATASDAAGSLPMPLQKLGVPGAILKDVGLFIGWVAQKRKEWW